MSKEQKEEIFYRKNYKKNSFQCKGNGTFFNKFQIVQKNKKKHYYSTKLVSNFVPTIKPKQSFCKPTFFKLDENKDSETKKEKKSSELENISSCEEEDDSHSINNSNESSYLSSSSSENDIKEEENSINNSGKIIQKNNIFNLDDIKQTKKSQFSLLNVEKGNDNDNKSFYLDENKENNIFIRKEKIEIKFKTVIVKSKKDIEMLHNRIKISFNQNLRKNKDIIDNSKVSKNIVVNKNENSENKNIIFPCKKLSILDILSKNKKKKN